MRWVVRHLRRLLVGLFATVVIVLAVGSLAGRLLVPMVDRYPDRVAALLGRVLQQPVTLESVHGTWHPGGPLLEVVGLRIGAGGDALAIPRAALKIDLYAFMHRPQDWVELRVRGVQARVKADADGIWHLAGFAFEGARGVIHRRLPSRIPVTVVLRDLALEVHDPARGLDLDLRVPRARILGRDGRLRLAGRLRQPGTQSGIEVVANLDPEHRSGRLYLAGQDVSLAPWGALPSSLQARIVHGHGQLQVWLAWRAGRLRQMTARFGLHDLVLARQQRTLVRVPHFAGLLQYRRGHAGWRLHWQPQRDAGDAAAALDLKHLASGRWRAHARNLDLGSLAPWLALWPPGEDGELPPMASLRPWGRLAALSLDWHDRQRFALHARVEGLGWRAAVGLPGLDHLDAELRGDARAISLHLPDQAATLVYPGVFRKPFEFAHVRGDIGLWASPRGWRIGSDNLALEAAEFDLAVRGTLSQGSAGAWPRLDVAARVTRATVPAAKLFWPVNVMPADAVQWLDRALVSGRLSGRALYRGTLGAGPFAGGPGRFEAVADFADAVLDYDADWPEARALGGRARFVNESMQVTARAGSTGGNQVDAARATIADFRRAVVQLKVHGHGQTERLLGWLRDTPVGRARAAGLGQIESAGAAGFALQLELPLHDAGGALRLAGDVQLHGVRLRAPAWSFALDGLRGPLHFDAGGVHAAELSGSYHGTPVQLALRIGDAVKHPDVRVAASMQGHFDAATLAAGRDRLQPWAAAVHGRADFDIGLQVFAAAGHDHGDSRLTVNSDLVGMRVALPEPLAKTAAAPQPLHLQLDLATADKRLFVSLGKLAQARLRLGDANTPLAVDVGLGEAAQAPGDPGVWIHGQVAVLDASGWLQRALAAAGGTVATHTPALRLDIRSDQVLVSGASLGPLTLQAAPQGDILALAIDGKAVAGSITLPWAGFDQRGITARLERLYWPDSDADADAAAKAGDEALPPAAVAPSAVPPLHLWIKDLRLGAIALGNVRVETVPIADGMQVQRFESQSDDLEISARGTWVGTRRASHSRFSVDLTADDLGKMLATFGYSRLVAGGATLVHIEGRWPGSPLAFSLARLDGSMQLLVTDGRILQVEPGVGRLFGLFSIRELPRRLNLDFGDIFQSGYSFNRIEGRLRFASGNAFASDLKMFGPSADLVIRGRTGLTQRDYDELITVIPHLGVAFPVVGAIAGGPVGAAAGLAVQGLLGKNFNRAAASYYRVTGSWDAPLIRKLQHPPLATWNPQPAASAPDPAEPAKAGSLPQVPVPAPASSSALDDSRPAPTSSAPTP